MTPRAAVAEAPAGERVKAARHAAGLTQRELAERLGVSLWTMERLETGAADAAPFLPAVAEATGASLADLGVEEAMDEPAADGAAHDGAGANGAAPDGATNGGRARAAADHDGNGASGLAALRAEAGMTPGELAKRLGVSLWEVERAEAGVPPTARFRRAAAEWAGRPIDELVAAPGAAPSPSDHAPIAAPAGATPTLAELTERGRGRWLVLVMIASLVLVRFFTEIVGVLPRAFNFIDVPLFVLLVVAGVFTGGLSRPQRREAALLAVPALILLTLCVLSALANPSRVEPAPALVFMYGVLAPLAVYWACYRLWPTGQASSITRLVVGLGVVQLVVVALIDVPLFLIHDNPDMISGTFGTNAYQLVFFLLVVAGVLAGMFTFEPHRLMSRLAPVLFTGIAITILLAQYRALLLTTILTVVLLTVMLGSARFRGFVAGTLLALALAVVLSYTAEAFPVLRYAPTIEAFREDPTVYVSARFESIGNIAEMFGDHPRYAATGSGPGTFSSRGWQTFAFSGSRSASNVQGEYATLLTGGAYRTDVSDEYVLPQYRGGDVIEGSRALTSPLLSYGSILAEIGLMGLVLVVGIYLWAVSRALRMTLIARRHAVRGDPLPALLFGATVALFVLMQMGLLENWLEVTRVTFPTWALLAVATKEFQARYRTQA